MRFIKNIAVVLMLFACFCVSVKAEFIYQSGGDYSGNITGDVCWKDTSTVYKISGSVYIKNGGVLRIEPGVKIESSYSIIRVESGGKVYVDSAELSGYSDSGYPVISFYEGSYGSLSNTNNSSGHIRISSNNIQINGGEYNSLLLYSASPTVKNSTLRGLYLNGDATTDNFSGNTYSDFKAGITGNIDSEVVLHNYSGLESYKISGSVYIKNGGVLRIEPGVKIESSYSIIRVESGGKVYVDSAELSGYSDSGYPVISFYEGSYGSLSNTNNSSGHIRISSNNIQINGGEYNSLLLYSASPTVKNSTLRGLYLNGDATTDNFSGNTYSDFKAGITGNIDSEVVLHNYSGLESYKISGSVYIKNGGVLRIEPGVKIESSYSIIRVESGGKVYVDSAELSGYSDSGYPVISFYEGSYGSLAKTTLLAGRIRFGANSSGTITNIIYPDSSSLVIDPAANVTVTNSPVGVIPTPPTNVDATTDLTDLVRITWDPPANATGTIQYQVYRVMDMHDEKVLMQDWTTETSYDDTDVPEGWAYYYWVKARNTAGESNLSAYSRGMTALPPETLSSVSITGTNIVNNHEVYTGTAYFSDGTTSGCTNNGEWSVISGSSYCSFDGSRLINANTTFDDKNATIKLSFTYEGITKTATKSITLLGQDPVVLSSLAISGDGTIAEDGSELYTAKATYSDGSSSTVTSSVSWQIISGSGYCHLSSNRLYNDNDSGGNQTATLKATYTDNGVSKTATKSITLLGSIQYSLNIIEPVTTTIVEQGERVKIQWADGDPDDGSAIVLAYSQNASELTSSATAIRTIVAQDTTNYDNWDTSDVPLGNYYIWCKLCNGNNGVIKRAPGLITIAESPRLGLSTAELGFGSVEVGKYLDKTITVQNIGGGILTGKVTASSPFSIISGSPYSLSVGKKQDVVIRFSPTDDNSYNKTASFTGANGGSVSLSGEGEYIPGISVSTDLINFGNNIDALKTFQVWNSGSGYLNYNITLQEGSECFRLTSATGSSSGSNDKTSYTVTIIKDKLIAGKTSTDKLKITSTNSDASPNYIDLAVTAPNASITANTQMVSMTEDTFTLKIWNDNRGQMEYTLSIVSGSEYFSVLTIEGQSTGPGDSTSHTIAFNKNEVSEDKTVTGSLKIELKDGSDSLIIPLSATKTADNTPEAYVRKVEINGCEVLGNDIYLHDWKSGQKVTFEAIFGNKGGDVPVGQGWGNVVVVFGENDFDDWKISSSTLSCGHTSNFGYYNRCYLNNEKVWDGGDGFFGGNDEYDISLDIVAPNYADSFTIYYSLSLENEDGKHSCPNQFNLASSSVENIPGFGHPGRKINVYLGQEDPGIDSDIDGFYQAEIDGTGSVTMWYRKFTEGSYKLYLAVKDPKTKMTQFIEFEKQFVNDTYTKYEKLLKDALNSIIVEFSSGTSKANTSKNMPIVSLSFTDGNDTLVYDMNKLSDNGSTQNISGAYSSELSGGGEVNSIVLPNGSAVFVYENGSESDAGYTFVNDNGTYEFIGDEGFSIDGCLDVRSGSLDGSYVKVDGESGTIEPKTTVSISNIALSSLGATATDNGYYGSQEVNLAIDGDSSTYWAGRQSAKPQTMTISFDQQYSISRIVIDEERAYLTQAEVEYYYDGQWQHLLDIQKSETDCDVSFDAVLAGGIRLLISDLSAPSGWGNKVACIHAFEVYGLVSGVDETDKISDHVFKIEIQHGYDYDNESSVEEYRFELRLETDQTVSEIDVLTPLGETITMTQENTATEHIETEYCANCEDNAVWSYWASYPQYSDLNYYGDGDYLFTIYYDDSTFEETYVWFGVPGESELIAEPKFRPVFTSPLNAGLVNSPVTFSWEQADEDVTGVKLFYEDIGTGDETELNIDLGDTSYGSQTLEVGLWKAGMVFIDGYESYNEDQILVSVQKYAEAEVYFGVTDEEIHEDPMLTVTQPMNGSIETDSGTYNYGSQATLTAVPDTGYRVKSWSGTDNDISTSSTNIVTMDGDKTVSVLFESIEGCSLTIEILGGLGVVSERDIVLDSLLDNSSEVSDVSGYYNTGQQIALCAYAQPGYVFKHWLIDGQVKSGNSKTFTVTDKGNYKLNEYELSFSEDHHVEAVFEDAPEYSMAVNSLIVKAGKTRSSSLDGLSVKISNFAVSESEASQPAVFNIYAGDSQELIYSESIAMPGFKKGKATIKTDKGIYKFDLSKDILQFKGNNMNLTGACSPISIELESRYYKISAIAYDNDALASGGDIDVINGSKPMPISLMSGVADVLTVDKFKYKPGKKENTDSLSIQGQIVLKENVDTSKDITVSYGDYSVTLKAEDISKLGSKNAYKYKSPKGTKENVVSAIFDLDKCTYSIKISKAAIGSQGTTPQFRLQSGSFDQSTVANQ